MQYSLIILYSLLILAGCLPLILPSLFSQIFNEHLKYFKLNNGVVVSSIEFTSSTVHFKEVSVDRVLMVCMGASSQVF